MKSLFIFSPSSICWDKVTREDKILSFPTTLWKQRKRLPFNDYHEERTRRVGREREKKRKKLKNVKHAVKTNQVFKRMKNSQFTLVLIIEEQNAHFLPRSLLFFDRPTSSYFFSVSRGASPDAGRRPKHENTMHSPRTRRPTILDTITLKYGPGSAEPNARLYARAASPPENARSPLLNATLENHRHRKSAPTRPARMIHFSRDRQSIQSSAKVLARKNRPETSGKKIVYF